MDQPHFCYEVIQLYPPVYDVIFPIIRFDAVLLDYIARWPYEYEAV